jgi:hypothetical protein
MRTATSKLTKKYQAMRPCGQSVYKSRMSIINPNMG